MRFYLFIFREGERNFLKISMLIIDSILFLPRLLAALGTWASSFL